MKTKPKPFTIQDARNQLSARWTHAEHETITASSQRGDITDWARGTTSFVRPLCDGPQAKPIRTRFTSVERLRNATRLSTPPQFITPPPIDCPKFSSEGGVKTSPGELADTRVAISDKVNSFYENLGKTSAVVRQY